MGIGNVGKSAGGLAPNGRKSAWVQNRIDAIRRLDAAVLPPAEARSLDGWRYIGGTKSLYLHGGGGAARGMVSQYMVSPYMVSRYELSQYMVSPTRSASSYLVSP